MILYMAVTCDKYELPLAVADSTIQLAGMVGVRETTIRSNIVRHCKRSHFKMKFMRIEVDDND